MASLRKNLSLLEEEKLVEMVRNYPILYDKSHQAYKERDAVRNAWEAVAMALDFIESAESARQCFEVFKKRYLRKRCNLKKANKSGTSSAVVFKVKKDFEPYSFFFWIDPYLKTRTTKSNMNVNTESVESNTGDQSELNSEQEEEDEISTELLSIEGKHPIAVADESNQLEVEAPQSNKRKIGRKSKHSKHSKISPLDERHMEKDLMRGRELNAPAESKDSIDAFCKSLALEIRQFDQRQICIIKHEINDIIFKHQMNRFNSQASFSTPQSSHEGKQQELQNKPR